MTVSCFHTVIISILISAKPTGDLQIPNREVMVDWGKWISTDMGSPTNILDVCVGGPVSVFEQRWPGFMQQHLHPKIVAKVNKDKSLKTPKNVYHAYFHGLLHSLGLKGWEVTILARAGGGYVDICLISKTKASAVLIELKSSEKRSTVT
jgi:hypothetical protein